MIQAPANVSAGDAVPDLTEGTTGTGWLSGNRNYWLPRSCQTLQQRGIKHCCVLGRVRYRIDTVIGHLTDRFRLKHAWEGDLWHLRKRRLLLVLMHTPGVYFNQQEHAPVLLLARPAV